MTVGEDIWVGEIMEIMVNIIIGCYLGVHISRMILRHWIQDVWNAIISYEPTFSIITRGSSIPTLRKCNTEEDLVIILSGHWFSGCCPLCLMFSHPYSI